MNHILKKTIQCLLSIFCVFGIMNTPVNTVKAEGGFIYQPNGWSDDDDGYSFPDGWREASNINGEGPYFFGYSSNENVSLETTGLDAISDSDISLINSNNDDVKSRAITVYSNYLMLNTDNLSVGEYTLTIKDSSLKVTVEKTYAVLKDTDGNEYTLGQNNLTNLKMGNKYTLTEVYKQTVSGKTNYTISYVTDNDNPYIDITNENGSYIIEPKEDYAGYSANFKIDTQEGFSLWPSYKIKENISYVGTIQINDNNSFVITFDSQETLDSISFDASSSLYLKFYDNNYEATFELKYCTKNDANYTITGDANTLSYGGAYVPQGKYSVQLSQSQRSDDGWEQVVWYLKAVNGNEEVTLTRDINKQAPEEVSVSLTEENGFILTCSESEVCSAYLNTFYDTNMGVSSGKNDNYSNSNIYGWTNGRPLTVPLGRPLTAIPYTQLFEKVTNSSGNTIALTVPFDDFTNEAYTNFSYNTSYSLKIHVIGYENYNINEFRYNYVYPDALPDGMTFEAEWDEENQKIVFISNNKELFEDSNLTDILGYENNDLSSGCFGWGKLLFQGFDVVEKDGKYYATFKNDSVYSNLAGYDNKKIYIVFTHNRYGTVRASNNPITLTNLKYKYEPSDLNIKIIGDGIVIRTSDEEFIDNTVDSLCIDLMSQVYASPEYYVTDNTKNKFVKVNDNQMKLAITQEDLELLINRGTQTSLSFDIDNSYLPSLRYSSPWYSSRGNPTIKISFEPIKLANSSKMVSNANQENLKGILDDLDKTATKLQNVTVVDTEVNNTDVSIVGNVAGAITENYEQGNKDSDLNLLPDSDDNKETITVKTYISNLDTEEANELANKVGGEATTAIDVSISKEYTKDRSKNTEITELPYDSVLTFDLPEASEEETYVVVREHEESDGTTSYTLLDVTENEDGIGSVASSKFSKFALVKQTTIEMVESPKSSTTEGSKTNLKFKTSGKANNVYLDNELVDPKNYESKDDGTVTLKEEYVSKLSAGKHTLKIITDKGMASSEFEITAKKTSTTTSKSTKTTNGWDDGGPFTTDTCGNVFDRWGNKIYEAKGCNVGGYNLVRTSVED